jgi:hypothetical protein
MLRRVRLLEILAAGFVAAQDAAAVQMLTKLEVVQSRK